jgi:hypothetical protein
MPNNAPYILTRRNLNPSARLLARALGLQKSYEPRRYAPVIRWGNSDGEFNEDTLWNSPETIHICSNKLSFCKAMTYLEIPHVEIRTGVPDKLPVVIRHSLSGMRGQGIEVATTPQEFFGMRPDGEKVYWSYWRDFSFELGVHIFNGEPVRTFKKVFRLEEADEDSEQDYVGTEPEFPIRNSEKGYGFRLVEIGKYPKLIPLVKTFCDKFGLKFGRLDIGWNHTEKKYEIIEANSAPGLAENENTARIYIEGFKRLLGKE